METKYFKFFKYLHGFVKPQLLDFTNNVQEKFSALTSLKKVDLLSY